MNMLSPAADLADALPLLQQKPSNGEGVVAGFKVAEAAALGFAGAWEIFQHSPFLQIYARHYGWQVIEHHGLVFAARRVPGLGLMRARLYAPEAGGNGDWPRLVEDLRAAELEVWTTHPVSSPNLRPSSAADLYSMVVDLRRGPDEVHARFESRARKAIRQAGRAGMQVRRSDNPRDLSDFHALLGRVTEQGKRYEQPPLALLKALHESGYARLYLARYQDRTVGGVFVLSYRHAYGLVSGFVPQDCHGLPSTLLYWETMRGEMTLGMPFLDMGVQTLSGNPGLVLAKRAYSPVLVPTYRYDLSPSPWRQKLAGAWRRLKRLAIDDA